MNITLMAHDKKKELMVQFCTAYKSILSKHSLSATAATGRRASTSPPRRPWSPPQGASRSPSTVTGRPPPAAARRTAWRRWG